MARLILVEFSPGQWAIVRPAPRYQELEDIAQCKMPVEYADKRKVVVTQEQLEALGTLECASQLVVNEQNELSKDDSWTGNLMSPGLVLNKGLKRFRKFITDELQKETPDMVQVARWQQQLATLLTTPIKERLAIYEFALASLQYAEVEKPTIRSKLEAKIAELAGA